MNCEHFQRRLLEELNPLEPSAEVSAHAEDCPSCQAWQQQLIRIERHVPLVPVPESEGKERFLRSLLFDTGPSVMPPIRRPSSPYAWRRPVFALGGIAAAVSLLLTGVLLISHVGRAPENQQDNVQAKAASPKSPASRSDLDQAPAATLVARLTECDVRLAQADTPAVRVQTLADLADALRDEAKVLGKAAAPEALDTVAVLYQKVVQQGIVERARAIPLTERPRILTPIAARLARVQQEVELVARTAGPTAAERLRRVAFFAREGDAQLRALVQGGTP